MHTNLTHKLRELGIAMQVMAQYLPPTAEAQKSFTDTVAIARAMRVEIELVGRTSAVVTKQQVGMN
jgi:uncharacterized protein YabE (DUF348 family)